MIPDKQYRETYDYMVLCTRAGHLEEAYVSLHKLDKMNKYFEEKRNEL